MTKIAYAGAEPARPAAVPHPTQERGTTGRIRKYNLEDVDRLKDGLSKEHYDVLSVALRYSYLEMIDVLGVNALGTVKSRLNRARNALDALLVAEKVAA